MFERIQRDVAARIAVTWTGGNDRQVSEQRIGALRVVRAVLTDERLWPVVAYRYKDLPVLGWFCKVMLVLVRIVMGVKIDGRIGPGLSIGHAACIFLNRHIVVGRDMRINQGTIIAGGKQGYPRLGDDVHVAAGAKIIGNITIGSHVHIGANAVVVHDVPSRATVVGIPARLVRHEGKKVDMSLKEFWLQQAEGRQGDEG